MVMLFTMCFNITKSEFCSQYEFMHDVGFSEYTMIISINSINRSVSVMELQRVLCLGGTKFLNTVQMNIRLQSID
jgi:hypothetical protein